MKWPRKIIQNLPYFSFYNICVFFCIPKIRKFLKHFAKVIFIKLKLLISEECSTSQALLDNINFYQKDLQKQHLSLTMF